MMCLVQAAPLVWDLIAPLRLIARSRAAWTRHIIVAAESCVRRGRCRRRSWAHWAERCAAALLQALVLRITEVRDGVAPLGSIARRRIWARHMVVTAEARRGALLAAAALRLQRRRLRLGSRVHWAERRAAARAEAPVLRITPVWDLIAAFRLVP